MSNSGGGVADGQSPPRPTFHEVQLIVDPHGLGSVVVDGVDLSLAVNGITFVSQVGDTTRMELALVAPRVEFDGQATIEIRYATRAALIALGWTPPAGDGQ